VFLSYNTVLFLVTGEMVTEQMLASKFRIHDIDFAISFRKNLAPLAPSHLKG
jgi:hypothetical protein